jgi:hypothetical protein
MVGLFILFIYLFIDEIKKIIIDSHTGEGTDSNHSHDIFYKLNRDLFHLESILCMI